ncbi:MAG TPA: Na+/H+ antiporter NhaC family protein [Epulopiscium sp.]|nr:Na+/H+ antiporter NhaC family protein [Candidatus Epulonipiscium sp.]
MSATIWALIPPIVAIALALITKEVYISLLVGILAGALLFTGFNPLLAVEETINIMQNKMSDNISILIFLAFLGILVTLITKSGASKAYGDWASKKIKSERGALLATSFLGMLIFIDDYFNCLTVGTVMRPVTDKYKVSRAKLAYVIDSTAAPVCIIAPISSWAAAVGSSLPENSGIDGFTLFIRTIPFNLYAILALVFMLYIIYMGIDFGPMKKHNISLEQGAVEKTNEDSDIEITGNGKVMDLILPIIVLIILCVGAMLYTGGILEGQSISEAFANCDSAFSLVLGSFLTLIITFVLYLTRKVISFKEFCDSFGQGVKSMVPAIMILSLAWTLSGICSADYLNIGGYVGGVIGENMLIASLLPAILFVIAAGLAFSTGTSWGTFGILIPIAISVVGVGDINLIAINVAAILAGAVCGDHISPISDTTILASAGAQCDHITHVSTQIPYALVVAGCSLVGFLISGITQNGWLGLGASLIVMAIVLWVITIKEKRTA